MTSIYEILRAGTYLAHRTTLAEACGAARDAARETPGVQVTVALGGEIKALYKLSPRGLQAVIK